MIVGIGNDLIEVERVIKACNRERFLEKCFTARERELIKNDKRKASDNFAVKEAVAKMFGTGFHGISVNEIEVLRNELGAPYINLYGAALALSEKLKIQKIHVSITNTKEFSSAYVIGEGKES